MPEQVFSDQGQQSFPSKSYCFLDPNNYWLVQFSSYFLIQLPTSLFFETNKSMVHSFVVSFGIQKTDPAALIRCETGGPVLAFWISNLKGKLCDGTPLGPEIGRVSLFLFMGSSTDELKWKTIDFRICQETTNVQ